MGTGAYGTFKVAGYWQDQLFPGLVRDGKVWEPHIAAAIAALVKPGDVFVDAGGNVVVHALLGGRLVGAKGRVHTFEAHPLNVRALRRSVKLNDLSERIQVHPVAVGATPSRVCMPKPNLDQRFSETKRGDVAQMEYSVSAQIAGGCGPRETEVPLVPLDDYKFPRVDLIKMDVQGSEQELLKGAETTILVHQPVIIFEIEDALLRKFNASSATMVSYLASLGYVSAIERDG